MKVTDIQGEADLNDLIQITIHQCGQDADAVSAAIPEFFKVLAESLAIHDRVELHGIGVFKLVKRSARHGITPVMNREDGTITGGVPWSTPERFEIEFEASHNFAKTVQEFSGIDSEPII